MKRGDQTRGHATAKIFLLMILDKLCVPFYGWSATLQHCQDYQRTLLWHLGVTEVDAGSDIKYMIEMQINAGYQR